MEFGDNVDDEWLAVYLLQALTKQYPGSVAKVWDNDGEFLLIEAAYSLPEWLQPATSANRVFLYAGDLHIVPLTRDVPGAAAPTLRDGLRLVRDDAVATLAPAAARSAIQAKTGPFPAAAAAATHVACCTIPARVAHVLRHAPHTVAAAVDAFYSRDADDMRAAARVRTFPPVDMVTVPVRFSRCLFAQLHSQPFAMPRAWPAAAEPSARSRRAAELGLKLTCGFEILCAEEGRGNADERTGGDHAAVAGGVAWERYVAALKRAGYFRGEIEGSRLHQELTAKAREAFVQSEHYAERARVSVRPAQKVAEVLRDVPLPESGAYDVDAAEAFAAESGGEWLEELEARVEGELRAREAERGPAAGGDAGAAGLDLDAMAEGVRRFVGHEGAGFEGAEVPGGVGGLDLGDGFADGFLGELKAALGLAEAEGRGSEGSELLSDSDILASSDSEGGSDSEDGGGGEPGIRAYAKAMGSQLRSGKDERGGAGDGPESDGGLDLNHEVLSGLLASMSEQQGLSGPAGALMGMLGLRDPGSRGGVAAQADVDDGDDDSDAEDDDLYGLD
ncbi:unnamed protein product [Pedinophyceae sp. YPF-701]|nr:unnamed protein product [Pedinophyceae sp. YPF-701]